jgi:transcriptional regulator with XRE-family HTH domain
MDTLKIGQYIQHLRKAAGMTQKELAEKLSIFFRPSQNGRTGIHLVKDTNNQNPRLQYFQI